MLYFEKQCKRWYKLVLMIKDTMFSWASIMNLLLWGWKQICINTGWSSYSLSGKPAGAPYAGAFWSCTVPRCRWFLRKLGDTRPSLWDLPRRKPAREKTRLLPSLYLCVRTAAFLLQPESALSGRRNRTDFCPVPHRRDKSIMIPHFFFLWVFFCEHPLLLPHTHI